MEIDMLRPVIAFLISPMAVPLLLAAYFFVPGARRTGLDDLMNVVIALVAYAGAFLVGLPTYLYMREKKWTAFWIAPIAGFMVAVVSWYVFIGLSPLLFGLFLYLLPRISQPEALLMALYPIGPIGAITAILLWLIARPDRPTTGADC